MANFYPTNVPQLIADIITANGNGIADTIHLSTGMVYELTTGYSGGNGLPAITSDIVIEGNGATLRRASFAPQFRFFWIEGILDIRNTTFMGGETASVPSPSSGGAIHVGENGTLIASNCAFIGNKASQGGAINGGWTALGQAGPYVTVSDCVFQSNQAVGETISADGGAINMRGGVLSVNACTLNNNKTGLSGRGGAIAMGLTEESVNTISNSVFLNNVAYDNGGAIFVDIWRLAFPYVPPTITGCTFSGNSDIAVHQPFETASYNIVNADNNQWGSPDGPSGAGSGSGDSIAPHITYTPFTSIPPTEIEGSAVCPVCIAGDDEGTTVNPISLRKAEKRLQETDIRLSSPASELGFMRFYRQAEQSVFTFMGMGWNHNHLIYLEENTVPDPDEIVVTLAQSKIVFYDDGAGRFAGTAGSLSYIEKSTENIGGTIYDIYTLTNSDRSIYRFRKPNATSSRPYLETRTWSNGDVWTYVYDSSDNLIEVQDGYNRSLKFVYYSGESAPDDFKNGKLKRVGTHSSIDLANNPQDPYVEFDYNEDNTGNVYLTVVRDVRDKQLEWAYRYNWQATSPQTDVPLSFLTERFSPLVDTDGDENADETITLEQLVYSYDVQAEKITQIVQSRGNGALENTVIFNTDTTIEQLAGRETKHHFVNEILVKTEDPQNNVAKSGTRDSYRPGRREDANGNATQLQWSNDGKLLEGVLDAKNNLTAFSYDAQDRLQTSTDAEGRITIYLYDADRRQPSLILVADTQGTEKAVNGDVEDNSDWSAVGSPTQNQSPTEKNAGDYAWYISGASGEGIESAATIALSANKTYLVAARVYVNSGDVRMKMSSTTDFDVVSQHEDEWESLLAIHTPSSATTPKLQFLADGGSAIFYVDSVHVVEIEGLHRWQHFAYDEKGRTLLDALVSPEDASLLQATKREYGTSGNGAGLLETIKQLNVEAAGVDETTTIYTYDAQGRVIKTEKSSLMGTCQFTYTVYDNAGNVLGTACGLVNTTAPTTIVGLEALYDANDATKKHTRITEHIYDEMGRRVSTTVNATTSFSRTSRTIYDALSRVVRTIDNYVVQYDGMTPVAPGAWVWNASSERWEYSASDTTPVSHGANNDENIISDTDYNERGLVYRRRDVLGRVTLSGYDLADRLVKTVQNASQPDYDASYVTGDPDLSGYVADSSIVDGDVISEQFYDAAGNLVKSIDARGSVSYTVYDALNRPIRTVQNAKATATIDLNVGDTGYLATNDPRSAGYVPSTAPDEDLISETVYDAMGRVQTSQRLLENRGTSAVWDTTYFVYDELGRQKRVIQHYVEPASQNTPDLWVYESGQWKDEPSGTAISHGSNDQNIITETVYDVSGRVKETLDVNRRVTRFVYDGLNRQVMTIANYVAQATEPENWAWSSSNDQWEYSAGNAVSHGTNNDENIISHTEYDGDGRVLETRNVEGLVQRNAYDTAGRSYLTVANFVDNSYQSPSLWVWDAGQTQWEDGNNVAIDRGTGFDQNIISMPDYDSENRVFQTRDSRGNLTRQVYDEAGRRVMTISNYVAQATEPEEWVWRYDDSDEIYAWRLSATNDVLVSFGANNDQNRISHTTYDILGRVVTTRDAAGRVSRTVYDALGRRTLVLQNEVAQANPPEEWEWDAVDKRWEDGSGTAIQHGTDFDQNIIAQTVYNRAGQVVSTRDARGTETTFEYDGAGRRVMVTAAANTGQRARTYTCYDKAGRVLRTIQGYEPTGVDPDAWDAGTWEFAPTTNGYYHDENRITEHEYDAASRRVKTINPEGDEVETAYFLDGQVDSMTDPMDVVTVYRYDQLNRRKLVVQNYVSNGEDPALWVWDTNQYEESDGTPIAHGTDNDENIIVQVEYDIAGRMAQMRDPRGNVTSYEYDGLGRRTKLTNPLSNEWVTAYTEVSGAQRTTMTYPGLSTGGTYNVVRDFDRMGRLLQMDYNAAANTPKVNFTYDILGNRQTMVENNGTGDIRKTLYDYDDANRLIEVGFDNDGGGTVDDTVEYEYDLGGRRTKLTMPGDLSIIYTYDEQGRLVSLTDWDAQQTRFDYDLASRHIKTYRPNAMMSTYVYDAAGRLQVLRHHKGFEKLSEFQYTVDARGNRVSAREFLSGTGTETIDHDAAEVTYKNTWTDTGSFHETSDWNAALTVSFWGDAGLQLVVGTGSDHSIFDVYINGSLWESFDAYAASTGERTIAVKILNDGLQQNTLEVRNRYARNIQSTGYKLRFKHLVVPKVTEIDYGYDGLSRLAAADYMDGSRSYAYAYDVAGNRLQEQVTIGITTTTTDWTYDNANRIDTMKVGSNPTDTFTYDANGNLTGAGGFTYTWDKANRLTNLNTGSINHHYAYDGDNNRLQQTVGGVATDYLLDIQPELTLVLGETKSGNTTHYLHSPRGVHAVQNPSDDWFWMAQDGLGSVRAEVDDLLDIVASRANSPYGQLFDEVGTFAGTFGFAGEQIDPTGQSYNRARYYDPTFGVFTALDRVENGNRYAYTDNNPVNRIDPNGEDWRDWLADGLEPVYNAFQDTFVESSWSQTIRDNPWAAVGIIAGASILAPIALVGGAVIVLPILVGAAGGGLIGYGSGQAAGTYFFDRMAAGECGCEKQSMALSMGRDAFVRQYAEAGALYGTLFGGLAASGPAGLAATGTISIGTGLHGGYQATQDIFVDGNPFTANDLNPCNLAELLLSGTAIVGGAGAIRGAQSWQQRIQQQRAQQRVNIPVEIEPDVPPTVLGQLRYIGTNTWESPAGLRYAGLDPQGLNRVQHVLLHLSDDLSKSLQGVYNGNPSTVLSVIDEAYINAQTLSNVRSIIPQGNRTIIEVNMGRTIGYVGGTQGAALGNPQTSFIRLVLGGSNTNEIVTAFPVR